MANRRMFSKNIIDTDAFMDMPHTSQLLYFHLSIRADDDGFVSSPKKIMRMTGSQDDDYKILVAKKFVIPFESGVCVIKHWLIHNLIRADLYKETSYKKEKETLGLNEYGAYTELREGVSPIKEIEEPKWLKKRRGTEAVHERTVNVPITAHRLGKVRLGKVSKVKKEPFGEFGTVLLKPEESQKLIERFGEKNTQILIFELDTYIASKGKKYKSHYATILSWAKRKVDTELSKPKRRIV